MTSDPCPDLIHAVNTNTEELGLQVPVQLTMTVPRSGTVKLKALSLSAKHNLNSFIEEVE